MQRTIAWEKTRLHPKMETGTLRLGLNTRLESMISKSLHKPSCPLPNSGDQRVSRARARAKAQRLQHQDSSRLKL